MKEDEISPELGAVIGIVFIIVMFLISLRSCESLENAREKANTAFYKMDVRGVIECKRVVQHSGRPARQLGFRMYDAQEPYLIDRWIRGYDRLYELAEPGDTISKAPDSWIISLKNASKGRNIEADHSHLR